MLNRVCLWWMYGFTVLVPFQSPALSRSGNRAGPGNQGHGVSHPSRCMYGFTVWMDGWSGWMHPYKLLLPQSFLVQPKGRSDEFRAGGSYRFPFR